MKRITLGICVMLAALTSSAEFQNPMFAPPYTSATTSISTRAPLGSDLTATAERAGKGS